MEVVCFDGLGLYECMYWNIYIDLLWNKLLLL